MVKGSIERRGDKAQKTETGYPDCDRGFKDRAKVL